MRESRQDTIFGKNEGTGCSCDEGRYKELQRERTQGEEHNKNVHGKAVPQSTAAFLSWSCCVKAWKLWST